MVNFSKIVRDSAKKGKFSPSITVLEHTWDVLVGPEIAQHMRPIRIKGTTLVVMVRPHWVTEWSRNKPLILESIAQYVPGIHNLEFEEGELPMPPQITTESPPLQVERTDIDATLERIALWITKERQQ